MATLVLFQLRCPYPSTNLSAIEESDSEIYEIRERQQKYLKLIEIIDHIQNDILLRSG